MKMQKKAGNHKVKKGNLGHGIKNVSRHILGLIKSKSKTIINKARPKKEAARAGSIQSEALKAKFSSPHISAYPTAVQRAMPRELPSKYSEDKIVIQTRDPWWIHAYWEVTEHAFNSLRHRFGELFDRAKTILRVYDVSYVGFNGSNANSHFDVDVTLEANNWYLNVGPGRWWCVDLGILLPDGRFIMIVRSNVVGTPLEGPSWITDEEWMIPDDMFGRLYGLGIGFGKSSPTKGWQERLKRELASGSVSSLASPVKMREKQRKFWLVVNTELIVYGATEPDARVTVQGQPIKLRPDGTFSLRFALPDGKQVIPVSGTSADEVDTITITPIVNKETR